MIKVLMKGYARDNVMVPMPIQGERNRWSGGRSLDHETKSKCRFALRDGLLHWQARGKQAATFDKSFHGRAAIHKFPLYGQLPNALKKSDFHYFRRCGARCQIYTEEGKGDRT